MGKIPYYRSGFYTSSIFSKNEGCIYILVTYENDLM
jgi:hypothetical protein